jgi:peptidoglycan/xylan/chitin deacetylase (PgdA/CDA1 family)
VSPNELDESDEREMILDVFDTMTRREGKAPGGWMSPGANPSPVTEDLLAEIGFTYTLDWPMDDQPTWMQTRGGPLLSVPYPQEVNDVPMIALHHGTAGAFADMMTDNLDEMIEQSQHQALVYGITIHTFIMGQPYRLRRFREALEHLLEPPDVWLTTPGEIVSHYAGITSPATELTGDVPNG